MTVTASVEHALAKAGVSAFIRSFEYDRKLLKAQRHHCSQRNGEPKPLGLGTRAPRNLESPPVYRRLHSNCWRVKMQKYAKPNMLKTQTIWSGVAIAAVFRPPPGGGACSC